MSKLFLIAIILILAIVSGLAIALNHFIGWKGLIAFPFILIALVWAGKVVIGKAIKRFFLGLFSMKSVVLRGATTTEHSVVAMAKPVESETSPDDSDKADASDEKETIAEDDEEEQAQAKETDEPEQSKHHFDVKVTITPTNSDRAWEPGELILTTERISSLADLEDGEKELGRAVAVRVWDSSQFRPDDPGKYPGQQRLKLTFEVKPGVSKAWLHYYNERIGTLELPIGESRR